MILQQYVGRLLGWEKLGRRLDTKIVVGQVLGGVPVLSWCEPQEFFCLYERAFPFIFTDS